MTVGAHDPVYPFPDLQVQQTTMTPQVVCPKEKEGSHQQSSNLAHKADGILGWKQLVNICLKEALNSST